MASGGSHGHPHPAARIHSRAGRRGDGASRPDCVRSRLGAGLPEPANHHPGRYFGRRHHRCPTRQYAALLSKNLDQNVIVENRPVAGGAVAAAAVQGAAPDGYTLLSAVGSQFCSVPAMGPAPYDPVKGFAPISLTFRLPTLLIVPIDSPAKTVAELFAWGKTKPGGLLLGSPGPGTPGHLLGAKIALATNTPIQYVHYRGGAPIMADLITGRLDFSLATFNSARSNMDAKKLRALAVDAETRLPP